MTDQTILFVDDEAHLRIAAEQTFELADLKIACFERAEAVLSRLEGGFDGILVTDIRMPGMDGVTLLARALAIDPDLPVIMVTGHADVDLAVRCIKEGAYDFFEKPWPPPM